MRPRSSRSRRGAVHGSIASRLAALESAVAARNVVPVVVAHVDGRVDGCGKQTWPSLDAMYADLADKQTKMPLVIRLAVDAPEEARS